MSLVTYCSPLALSRIQEKRSTLFGWATLVFSVVPAGWALAGDLGSGERPSPAIMQLAPDGFGKAATAAFTVPRQRLAGVKLWAAQIQNLDVSAAASSHLDMIVVDATAGARDGKALSAADVTALKRKPDGGRRLVISYLSIGESEDYRRDYFASEYMTEDAPDWLLKENRNWKGNRLIRFCEEGWQKTILGDHSGRSLYNSLEPAPLTRLIELGFDGVTLDRVDVYAEVRKDCPDSARRMINFVDRLAAQARRSKPGFLIVMQNAEELLTEPRLVAAIDGVIKEDLFFGVKGDATRNDPAMVKSSIRELGLARGAGKPVFVIEYMKEPKTRDAARSEISARGFVPYIGPRALDILPAVHSEGEVPRAEIGEKSGP